MGKLKNGAFGHVTGRIGNLVCYTLNGENITRQVGTINKAPTEKKLANYQRLTVANTFQKTILPFLNLGLHKLHCKTARTPTMKPCLSTRNMRLKVTILSLK